MSGPWRAMDTPLLHKSQKRSFLLKSKPCILCRHSLNFIIDAYCSISRKYLSSQGVINLQRWSFNIAVLVREGQFYI